MSYQITALLPVTKWLCSCINSVDCGWRAGGDTVRGETEATMIKWGNNSPQLPWPQRASLGPHSSSHSLSLYTRKTANMCQNDISFPQIMELPGCNNNLNFTPRYLGAEGSPKQWHKLASMHWADRWLPRPPPIDLWQLRGMQVYPASVHTHPHQPLSPPKLVQCI